MTHERHPTCKKKDHDGFDLICGHPLPCPYHTVVIDVAAQTVQVPMGDGETFVTIPASRAGRLGDVAEALRPPSTPARPRSRGRR